MQENNGLAIGINIQTPQRQVPILKARFSLLLTNSFIPIQSHDSRRHILQFKKEELH